MAQNHHHDNNCPSSLKDRASSIVQHRHSLSPLTEWTCWLDFKDMWAKRASFFVKFTSHYICRAIEGSHSREHRLCPNSEYACLEVSQFEVADVFALRLQFTRSQSKLKNATFVFGRFWVRHCIHPTILWLLLLLTKVSDVTNWAIVSFWEK